MKTRYPTPQEVGIEIPIRLIRKRFEAGFNHALKGGNITQSSQLKLSFREGFRAAKLYLKQLRQQQGVSAFPLQGRIAVKAA